MPLLLRRLAGAVSAPIRRSLSPSARRPGALPGPWSTAGRRWTRQGRRRRARARPWTSTRPRTSPASQSLPTSPTGDGMDFAAASVRATSSDGLLLLDLAETRHCFPAPPHLRGSIDSAVLDQMAAAGAATELDVARFVCNPLSGQLFRLPVPDMDVAKTSTVFGLLTQSDGSRGPPDRYAVAQLCCRALAGERRLVVRRFLSETGEWDERQTMPCFVPPRVPCWDSIPMHTSHGVLSFGDRLWWFDVTWGAVSVDPFSDRPDARFVELPRGSVRPDVEIREKMLLNKLRLMGVSEGKLRYVELSTEAEPFKIRVFSLDEEGCCCCWKLTHHNTVTILQPNKAKPRAAHMPWIAAIDPFDANILYFDLGHTIFAMDIAKRKVVGSRSCPDSITGLSMYRNAFVLPCVLPAWLESSHIPVVAGTLSSKKTNHKRKTLADMLVRADRG